MTRPHPGPSRRAARASYVLVPVAGLLLSVLTVWQSSYSAFTATTENPGNSWTAGSVTIEDNDSGVAMFAVTGLMPGATGSRCIAVTSTGTVPASVKLYGKDRSTTNALSSHLSLTVTQGTGTASSGSCADFAPLGAGSAVYSGTLAAFTATSFADGVGSWTPTGTPPETRTYQFSYTFSASAPNSTQGGTAQITFVWEAQST